MRSKEWFQIWEKFRVLSPLEQQNLWEAVGEFLRMKQSEVPEDRLEVKMFEKGVLEEIKAPITDFTPYENRKLIESKGKPLSEIIIEERR